MAIHTFLSLATFEIQAPTLPSQYSFIATISKEQVELADRVLVKSSYRGETRSAKHDYATRMSQRICLSHNSMLLWTIFRSIYAIDQNIKFLLDNVTYL